MIRNITIALIVGLLLIAGPGLAATTGPQGDPAPGPGQAAGCTNYGIITQVTILGENSYCEDQACENHGIILFVGRTSSCYGDGASGACVGDQCRFADLTPTATSQDGPPELDPDTSNTTSPCGITTDPICWTTSFGCRWIWETWHGTVGPHVGDPPCECHDGDPYCEPQPGPGRPPLVILVVEREARP